MTTPAPPAKPAKPRDAASVVLVKHQKQGLPLVLMGRRSRRAAFVPDVFVFPGGRAEAQDDRIAISAALTARQSARIGAAQAATSQLMARRLASAAIRETWEETGYLVGDSTAQSETLTADHSALTFAARAITPRISPIRFHARFFLADGAALTGAPGGCGELTDLAWYPLEEARRLPIIDVTEFLLNTLPDLLPEGAPMPVFTYRRGKSGIRWVQG